MPSLRPKRDTKSRTSTPFGLRSRAESPAPQSDSAKGKQQSFLDTWIEPPTKNPTPSFEDHGFLRHGVLENMAPLGTPPSSKLKHKLRSAAEGNSRRSTLNRNGNLLSGEDAISTPEMTPAPELEQEESDRQEDEVQQTAVTTQDEDDDEDYVPNGSGKPGTRAAKTPARNATAKMTTPIRADTAISAGSPANIPTGDGASRQRTLIAVNEAQRRANDAGNATVGFAVKQLHQESLNDPELASVLNSILYQTHNKQQLDVFRDYIKKAKRTAKNQLKRLRTSSTVTEPGAKPSLPISPILPQPSPRTIERGENTIPAQSKIASNAATSDISALRQDASFAPSSASPFLSHPTEVHSHLTSPTFLTKTSTTSGTASMAKSTSASSRAPKHKAATESPPETAPVLKAAQEPARQSAPIGLSSPSPPSSGRASKSKSPKKRPTPNADSAIETSSKAPSPALSQSALPPSPLGESDSELSEVNEDIVQNGPPEPLKANGTTAGKPKKSRAAQIARSGRGSRAGSAKPAPPLSGKTKPMKKSAASMEEDAEYQRKRDSLLKPLPELDIPISAARFETESPQEDSSFTSSHLLPDAQADTGRPRRAVRSSRNNSAAPVISNKRPRDTGSRLPTPGADSAATTRPTTPAISLPAPKRLKLTNGQSARIKRSPVKNRDGLARTGGGWSALGPDDNGPSTPSTDNHDYCDACFGTLLEQEVDLLCCDGEGCRRSFHLVCCDPPYKTIPEEQFFCNECQHREKAKRGELDSQDGFKVFNPLLSALEPMNVGIFQLPEDIRDYYEGVITKPDGSYFEPVKKISLSKSNGYGAQKPDYLKQFDNGKVVLCASCGKSSAGKNVMLCCDFCHDYWHLDCLDPPAAKEPSIAPDAIQRDPWKCPRHIDHDFHRGNVLQHDLNNLDADDTDLDEAPEGIPRKVRKRKNPTVVEPLFSRGNRNNGNIEIINDPDEEVDSDGNYIFYNDLDESTDQNAKVMRIPEKGIILDFLDKVKLERYNKQKRKEKAEKEAREANRVSKVKADNRKQALTGFLGLPLERQQAALHLTQVAQKETDIGLTGNNIESLLVGLASEAPDTVMKDVDSAPPAPLSEETKAELRKMQELIDRALTR